MLDNDKRITAAPLEKLFEELDASFDSIASFVQDALGNPKPESESLSRLEQHVKLLETLEKEVSRRQIQDITSIPSREVGILRRNRELIEDLAWGYPELFSVGQGNLIRSKEINSGRARRLKPSAWQWHLNLGFLLKMYRGHHSIETKRKVAFLALNYLAKASPISVQDINIPASIKSEMTNGFDLGLLDPGIAYSRASGLLDSRFREKLRAILPSCMNQLFFILDTKDVGSLLPLKFQVVNGEGADLEVFFGQALDTHFADRREEGFDHFIAPSLVVDFGDSISGTVQPAAVEEQLRTMISLVSMRFAKTTNLDEVKLVAFLKANVTCISRTEVRGTAVLAVLSFFCNPDDYVLPAATRLLGVTNNNSSQFGQRLIDAKMQKANVNINEFLNQTGVRLGAVKAREKICNFVALDDLLESEGALVAETTLPPWGVSAFSDPKILMKTEVFQRFKHSLAANKSIEALGVATINLLEGFFGEVSEVTWAALYSDPVDREILQNTIAMLLVHVADAENQIDDTQGFIKAVELLHYDLSTLLYLTKPYHVEDYRDILVNTLSCIPDSLKGYVKGGIGNSGMNVLAGICATVEQVHPGAIKVIDRDCYYENVEFLGHDCTKEVVLKSSAPRVDLYLGEFSRNINRDPAHDHYTAPTPIGDIEELLSKKAQTDHLTVAIDATIDLADSPRVKAILHHFEKQIVDGKLNFIFFRSGQKFDMLGMDNYYGAPYYVVNNGAEYWSSFRRLTKGAEFTTDDLSIQWFCLAQKYAGAAIDAYRLRHFQNTQEVLNQVPPKLTPGNNSSVKVCTMAPDTFPCFIDLKITGERSLDLAEALERDLYERFAEANLRLHTRPGYGFPNTNLNLYPQSEGCTIRINPGIDKAEVELVIDFLQALADQSL